LPVWVHDRIFEIGQNNPFTMHLIQETGTLWVLVGMLFIWFARHYDHSTTFHWAVTFYLSLDAFVHWFSAYGRFENGPRAVINAIPFFLFLVLGLLRRMQPNPQMEPTRADS
jgi:predicted PurR-regulated permease PerM